MNAIRERIDTDYRLIYLIEEAFSRRIMDIYLGCSSKEGAPFLEDVLNELWDMMVFAYVASVTGTPEYDKINWQEFHIIEATGDPLHAFEFITTHADEKFCDLFHRDVYLFLMENQLNFFIRPLNRMSADRYGSRLVNPTIIEVW